MYSQETTQSILPASSAVGALRDPEPISAPQNRSCGLARLIRHVRFVRLLDATIESIQHQLILNRFNLSSRLRDRGTAARAVAEAVRMSPQALIRCKSGLPEFRRADFGCKTDACCRDFHSNFLRYGAPPLHRHTRSIPIYK